MPAHRALPFRTLAAAVLAMAVAAPVYAAALDITLGFASLPSAQGFTYTPTGAHAGVLESSVFAVSGGTLFQNTMGQSNGVSGGSIFYVRSGGITTTETKQLRVRARCLEAEGSANATLGQGGLVFGFSTGSVQFAFGLTPTRISNLTSAGTVVVSGTFDNTQFHDYVFDWTSASSYRLFRDGVLIYTSSTGFAVAANRVFFGDGTGGANARGEVTAFRFVQDLPTPAASGTWGRLKAVYR